MVRVMVGTCVVHCVYKSPQKDTRKCKNICELHTHRKITVQLEDYNSVA